MLGTAFPKVCLRQSGKCAAATLSKGQLGRQHKRLASAIAVPTQRSHEQISLHDAKRDASLSNPDPAADSQTARMVDSYTPYMVATYVRPPPVMVKGEGSFIYDMENRQYLDFTAGIAVNALGHCDSEVAGILAQQSQQLMHCSNLYHNAWTGKLSQILIDETRKSGAMQGASKVFVCNSGSEANEAALKFARKVGKMRDESGKKTGLVSFHGSFHGRTMGSLSATPNPKYQKPFSPMVPGFTYAEFNDIGSIKSSITDATCGVIVEPIQGEGGVNVATEEFLQALRNRCTEVGAVLIYDEIQCGLGRTGSFWSHGNYPASTHPDILTTAKALGNGFPIGAAMVTEDVAKCIVTGDHGTTFGGNPLGCAVAHNIVGRLANPALLKSVRRKEQLIRQHADALNGLYPKIVTEMRGKGLILGLQLSCDPTPLVTAARERGLLIITAGTNTIRFVPPLTITEAEINQGFEILKDAMQAVFGSKENIEPTKGQQEMAPEGR